jgi:hypothetical protein
MDYESIINHLSQKWNQNSRNSVQSDLKALFKFREAWSVRAIPGLSIKRFETFTEFATHRPPWGLGWTKNVLEAFILPELSDIWQQIEDEIPKANPKHIHKKEDDIIYNIKQQGTSREYSISVLKRDAPEIADKVIKNEISASQGMVMAGKKKPMCAHPATVDGFYNAIQKKLSENEIKELKELL